MNESCETFEIQIEMRRADALDAEGIERLEAHLSGCPACRRYERLAARTEDAMSASATKAIEEANWADLEARVRGMASRYARAVVRMTLALLVVVPLIGWAAGLEAGVLGALLGGGMIVYALALRRRRAHEAVEAARTREDLLRYYRDELDRRIRRSRTGLAISLAVGAFLVVLVTLAATGLVATSFTPRLLVFNGVWGAVLLAGSLHRLAIGLPRLRAERAELA
jgi:hypothetical protein